MSGASPATVWVVIAGQDWPRQVERVCSSRGAADAYAAAMNGARTPIQKALRLWWVEEWAVRP